MLAKAIEKIKEQSNRSKNYNVQYCAAELIKILEINPDKAELVIQDLEHTDMSIANCEKKIDAYFRTHRAAAGTTLEGPLQVISDFYGLNIDAKAVADVMYRGAAISPAPKAAPTAPTRINLDDLL